MELLSSEDERINEEEIRKSMELYEKEKMLTKEIQDLEKAEMEVRITTVLKKKLLPCNVFVQNFWE